MADQPAAAAPSRIASDVALIVAAGCCAGGYVGKVPLALPQLQADFAMSLVEASLVISFMLLAAVLVGIVGGMVADRFGQRRMMVIGLSTLAFAGLAGAASDSVALLLASRALESVGFLATVLPGPALLVRQVPPARLRAVMGFWSSYMPAGMAAVMLAGPWLMQSIGWRGIWAGGAAAALLLALLVRLRLPADRDVGAATVTTGALVAQTLSSPRPWLLACVFCCYTGQWMGLFGFLPTMYQQLGVGATAAGWLTAFGVLVNIAGNIGAGALSARGVPRHRVVILSSLTMLVCAWIVFAGRAPFALAYGALLAFSAVGGLIPGTLFASAPSFAPSPRTLSTTTGLMQQGSAVGQFVTPPLLAAMVAMVGDWSASWLVTGALALVNVGLAMAMRRVAPRG
ncbi:MAG: CynX/NimT family MFS transporter [Lautropia sp.]